MESVYLKQLVKSTPQGGSSDLNAPYSFLEWKERVPLLVEKDTIFLYNRYVIEWFEKNKEKAVSQKFVLRQKYLYLLDQLQVFFSEKEKNTWYAQVNLADEKELLLAIPYFARKLKDIALYYLQLRKRLKHTKLKYNAVGSAAGIEQEIYNYFLETFTTNNNELSSSLYTTLPSFSALRDSLTVQVEELYDDKQYFDLSPTKPLSGYFDLAHQATGNFLATKGIILSSSEWLFESFSVPASTNFDSFIDQLTGNIFELSDTNLYGNFIQKYIAENKYSLNFTSASAVIELTDVNISAGNNYFYYPHGTTDASTSIAKQIIPVALSSINVGAATAGSSIETSDTIFVKNGDTVKSAWLRYQEYTESLKNVYASIKKDSATSFIFPFPGYGLSGQDLPWTGPDFKTSSEYDFMSKELKAQVNEAYWSQTLPNDSCNTILLNNTSLANSGATPNANPSFADQVFLRLDRSENTTTPFGELSGAWLYKFTKTSIPISPNESNIILWPYHVVSTNEEYPEYLNNISFSRVCNSVSIQDISNPFSVAASSFNLADKIYKLNNYADSFGDALECAWLSGAMVDRGGYRYVEQDGFAALFAAGQTTRFVWTGPESTLDSVFRSVEHKKDCPFATKMPSVSAFEWQKCSCKQVYHSPFGHSNKLFQAENSFADCIAKDTENQLTPFDLGSWRDSTNRPAISSLEFAWYRTKSEHSWGDGRWVSNLSLSAAPFKLQPGKAYFYKRVNSKTSAENMPSYVVNYNFNLKDTKWIKAKLATNGTWISTDEDSTMSLYPGEFLRYDRQKQTTSYLLTAQQVENTSTNNGSVWSIYDSIPVVCGADNSTTISWPIQTKPFGSTESQYPITSVVDITAVNAWKITRLEDNFAQTITNLNVITFVPPTTGTYSVAVTATKFGGTQIRIGGTDFTESTIIPKITAIPQYSSQNIELEFNTPSSGFLIEHDLSGWNYNTNKIDSNSLGARPYWAVLDSRKNSTTRYKGVYSWGYPNKYIDDYLPNSNPIISPIAIKYGTILEYFHKGYSFTWNQPITYKQFLGTTQWCEISSDTTFSSNLSTFYNSKLIDLNVIATTNPTDILLSNTLNGAPVEIFYYALNDFVWIISVEVAQIVTTPIPTVYFETQAPWTTLTNRFYPTIANIPTVEETYSEQDVGGYFLPQNLGASQFINKDFTSTLKTTNLSGAYLTEDTNIHVGGRGRTKEDQNTLYDWTENNQWLKESATTGDLAGAVKKSLTKTLQTFIPYQSNIEETSLGLVTPRSRISPWGGLYDEQWTDVANEPKGFTGIRSVSAWAASQVLKQNQKAVDCWTSDIYGNQYGLFKHLDGIPIAEHINTFGELWTKTNDQVVNPAYVSLSAIFEPFKIVDLSVYKELTGNEIKCVDCYFDNLFIETKSSIIFAGINYNFDKASINSTFDDTRYRLLNDNLRFDRNWFFSVEKKVVSLFTEITGNNFYPALHELDLTTRKYKKIFPINSTDSTNLISSLSGIEFAALSKGTLHFNTSLQAYLITYTGTDKNNKMFIVDLYIKKTELLNLIKIDLYRDLYNSNSINEPPVVLTPYLTAINVGLTPFTISVSATNNPTSYSLLNYTTEVTAITSNGYGVFTGTLSAGLHHINYSVSNNIGESIYCLTLSAL